MPAKKVCNVKLNKKHHEVKHDKKHEVKKNDQKHHEVKHDKKHEVKKKHKEVVVAKKGKKDTSKEKKVEEKKKVGKTKEKKVVDQKEYIKKFIEKQKIKKKHVQEYEKKKKVTKVKDEYMQGEIKFRKNIKRTIHEIHKDLKKKTNDELFDVLTFSMEGIRDQMMINPSPSSDEERESVIKCLVEINLVEELFNKRKEMKKYKKEKPYLHAAGKQIRAFYGVLKKEDKK